VEDVLELLAGRLDESVVVLERGVSGYPDGYLVGPVRVFAHPERPDMGVMVEVTGEGCEQLGTLEVLDLAAVLELRASRVDLALDGADFTPKDVRDAWRAGDVRTRSQVPADALPDRQWRTCEWRSTATGDLFGMGARSSRSYVRVYDRRGFTRLELELKAEAAIAAASALREARASGAAALAAVMMAWVRRSVDFVDASSDTNSSRRELLPWWAAFVGAVEAARVRLVDPVTRTLEDAQAWVERQVAPVLAVLERAMGTSALLALVRGGSARWRGRHRALLAQAGGALGTV
jgi:DNA relaxase NicK